MLEKIDKRRSYARREFLKVRSDVEVRLEQGYSRALIYEELLEEGRLSMTYQSFCDYVRGGKKKATRAKRDTAELLSEIMDSIEHRTEAGINLKSVFRKLEECGLTGAAGFSYADFCEYFREAGGYLGRDIPDAFMFFNDDDGLIAFYYRLAAFLDRESDKAASRKLQ